jgi:subtilisin family serine protease
MVTAAAAPRALPVLAGLLLACALAGPVAAAPSLEARELAKIGFAPAAGPEGGLHPAMTPNDPLFLGANFRWVFERPRFLDGWSRGVGDARTIIAIVDTGVDPTVADLQGAVLPGYDFADGDTDTSDPHGHGTMMAGLAAARTNNGIGIAGACGACSILPVRVSEADGNATWSATAAGIVWAADHGARIISVSLVGPASAPVLDAAVAYAQSRNALVVAAAGNDAQDRPAYPAALPGVVSVQATDEHDSLYPFSNHGAGISISAPGCAIVVAPGDRYKGSCGTSVAAPLVAGAAGLLASASPGATATQLADALAKGAVRATDSKYGRLDVVGALSGLVPSAGPPLLLVPPTVAGQSVPGATLTASVGDWSGGATTFAYQWLRCATGACTPIRGATLPTYTVVAADRGSRLEVRVTATGDGGRVVVRSSGAVVAAASKRRSSGR